MENDFTRNWFFPPHAYYTQQIQRQVVVRHRRCSPASASARSSTPTGPAATTATTPRSRPSRSTPTSPTSSHDKLSVAVRSEHDVPEPRSEEEADSPRHGGDVLIRELRRRFLGLGPQRRHPVQAHGLDAVGPYLPQPYQPECRGRREVQPPTPVPASGYSGTCRPPADLQSARHDLRRRELQRAPRTSPVGGGIYWTRWETYNQLQINFGAPFGPAGASTSATPKNWDNVYRFMIGAEWKVNAELGPPPRLCLRPGARGPDSTIDYILPDNDRNMFSLGARLPLRTTGPSISPTP
ncbi:MAG: outer membrane protein transport protein [Desulfobacterales bacterium]|nr:outer membrane protein transport protein [Desulfobacterales bacterium]